MNRAGFTLLELLIATLIASILSALLFAALFQVNRYVPVIDNLTGIYEKAAIVNAQLERDLSGVTAPNEFYARQKKVEPKKGEDAKKESAAKKEDEEKKKAAEAKAEADKEKSKKPLEKIFYGVNKESNLDQLSFITTNSLQVYWSDKAGSAKPRIVRVLYMLKEEPTKDGKKSYSLIRRESNNLEFDPIAKGGKDISEYVLAEGIKSAQVEYTFFPPEEPAPSTQPTPGATAGKQVKEKKESKKTPDWAGKRRKKQKLSKKYLWRHNLWNGILHSGMRNVNAVCRSHLKQEYILRLKKKENQMILVSA